MRGARASSSDAGAYSNGPARGAFFAPSRPGVPEGYSRRARARVRFAPVACHSRMGQPEHGAGEGYRYEDAARVHALAFGTCAPGTAERMGQEAAAAGVDPREVEGWVEAFRLVQVLRLRDPLERRSFREALRAPETARAQAPW